MSYLARLHDVKAGRHNAESGFRVTAQEDMLVGHCRPCVGVLPMAGGKPHVGPLNAPIHSGSGCPLFDGGAALQMLAEAVPRVGIADLCEFGEAIGACGEFVGHGEVSSVVGGTPYWCASITRRVPTHTQ